MTRFIGLCGDLFMARPKRIDVPHTLYHVMSRTISGEAAFRGDGDYLKFLHYLAKYVHLFHYRVHGYCLLSNHFHLLLESGPHAFLSELMRRLLTAYTVYYNRRHSRHGHLFQGRFKSMVVEKANYLLPLSRYIHTNPSRGKKPLDPETYKWSSLHFYLDGKEPAFLFTKEILGWFQGKRRAYADFIREGLNEKTKFLIVSQRFVGGQAFVKRWDERLKKMANPKDVGRTSMEKSKLIQREAEEQQADMIVRSVARAYGYKPEVLISGRSRRGALGQARTILCNLLRDYLPWSCRSIAEFLKIKEVAMIYHHRNKLIKNRELREIYSRMEGKIRKNL